MSPSNEAETRANIWAYTTITYTTIPSVQEILIVHSTRVEAELLRLTSGKWPKAPAMCSQGSTIELQSIGLSFLVDELYRKTTLKTPA